MRKLCVVLAAIIISALMISNQAAAKSGSSFGRGFANPTAPKPPVTSSAPKARPVVKVPSYTSPPRKTPPTELQRPILPEPKQYRSRDERSDGILGVSLGLHVLPAPYVIGGAMPRGSTYTQPSTVLPVPPAYSPAPEAADGGAYQPEGVGTPPEDDSHAAAYYVILVFGTVALGFGAVALLVSWFVYTRRRR